MVDNTLRNQILEAIKMGNKAELIRLRENLKRETWLRQWDGNIPIKAWLEPNPLIKLNED